MGLFTLEWILVSLVISVCGKKNFETNCNSSQFTDLEILIGSIHNNAPSSVLLYVRDTGLLKYQRKLLLHYKNVKLISSSGKAPTETEILEIGREVFFVGEKHFQRISDVRLFHTDAIIKKIHLAIVIPFIAKQIERLRIFLNILREYVPCEQPFGDIDLIFYHDEDENSTLVDRVREIGYESNCFRDIFFMAASLNPNEDIYPLGSFVMWKKLFLGEKDRTLALRTFGYTHFFLMEPDTRPTRKYWLHGLIDEITERQRPADFHKTDWWMTGSVYRGKEPIGIISLHINGNALYHLSPNFISFVDSFVKTYPSSYPEEYGYDLAIFKYLYDNLDVAKDIWHKFKFSDFLQNCWHDGCLEEFKGNVTLFALKYPKTHFIHGGPKLKVIKPASNQSVKFWPLLFSALILKMAIFIVLLICQKFNGMKHFRNFVMRHIFH